MFLVAAVNHKKIGQPKKIYSQWTGDRRRSNSNKFSSSDTVSSDMLLIEGTLRHDQNTIEDNSTQ